MTETESYAQIRRHVLKSILTTGVCSLLPSIGSAGTAQSLVLASAYRDRVKGDFGVAIMDEQGQVLKVARLPGRGHVCLHNKVRDQLLTFARRPGTFIHVFDLSDSAQNLEIRSISGRHFYGHGCFNQSDTLLFATENDYNAAAGVIGVYDVDNGYRRIGEFPSFGVGPHDIGLLQDGTTLLVANGGIETHPDTGREKLNLLDMYSNLAFIDSRSGELLKTLDMAKKTAKLSLRHLAISENGDAYVAGQYQGGALDVGPLVATITKAGVLEAWPIPRKYLMQLKNYISSIEVIPSTPHVVITSSRSGIVLVWNTEQQRVEKIRSVRDVSGITAVSDTFYISDGVGRIHKSIFGELSMLNKHDKQHALQWDNHFASFLSK